MTGFVEGMRDSGSEGVRGEQRGIKGSRDRGIKGRRAGGDNTEG
jgi:hypothetical protein